MPEEPNGCPDASELEEFHEGRLSGSVLRRVEEHVEACVACRAELAELDLDHRFTAKLRNLLPAGAADPDPARPREGEPDAQYKALVALLRESAEGERYEVLGELGHGGMGVVLRVWEEDLRRHLAMKVMLAKSAVGEQGDNPRVDPRRLARFVEEAQVTGQLDHPGIVPVHELGLNTDGRAYFTMKLVKGQTLKDVFGKLS